MFRKNKCLVQFFCLGLLALIPFWLESSRTFNNELETVAIAKTSSFFVSHTASKKSDVNNDLNNIEQFKLEKTKPNTNRSNQDSKMKYAIAIHGGAGPASKKASDQANRERIGSMKEALEIGVRILKENGSSLDAVEAVVRFLEDDPKYNAGKGSVFNSSSEHELDASIMDGNTMNCGAVAGVKSIKNPISLARLVMSKSPHVMLAGDGADEFGAVMNVDIVDNEYFDTPATKEKWKLRQQSQTDNPQSSIQLEDTGSYHGTVGCVALDSHGNLAAATSTGGMTGKKYGRVGDSPIIGAGTYADNQSCAISCTGIGEQYIRYAVAYDVVAQMKYAKRPLKECVANVLQKTLQPNDGGIIAVDRNGNIAIEFTTPGMARAAADSTGRFDVLWVEDEDK